MTRRRRRVLSQKPAKTRAAHTEKAPTERTPWRRPLRANGKHFAHAAAARRGAAGLPPVSGR